MENSPLRHKDTTEQLSAAAAEIAGQHAVPQPEELGRFLISNESDPSATNNPEAAKNRRAETMSREELMDTSGKIMVEGTSLRKIYETHLISENGLRRLVGEYLRTGDIRGLLKLELLQHEIDFERDPQLRDKIKRQMASSGGDKAIDNLLQEAGLRKPGEEKNKTEKLAAAAAKAFNHDGPGVLQPQQRRMLDIAFISIISILLLLILILAIRRI